jgi:hypothetical protein
MNGAINFSGLIFSRAWMMEAIAPVGLSLNVAQREYFVACSTISAVGLFARSKLLSASLFPESPSLIACLVARA